VRFPDVSAVVAESLGFYDDAVVKP